MSRWEYSNELIQGLLDDEGFCIKQIQSIGYSAWRRPTKPIFLFAQGREPTLVTLAKAGGSLKKAGKGCFIFHQLSSAKK